jgi:pimeloyl-ACP methyl ester carboxylesterase
LIRERIVIDSESEMSIPLVILRRPDLAPDKKGRAIICSHGHGPFGKETVVGNVSTEALRANIALHNYNYAEQMALKGFLTLSLDLRGFGERAGKPIHYNDFGDPCNLNYLCGSILGQVPLALNLWDIQCSIRYLETRPEVDPGRIAMMGLSLGGTVTTLATVLFPEIKCADIIGYLAPWLSFAFKKWNFCGSQILPDLYAWFDTHDIAGLIAPRPLLVEIGRADSCFPLADQLESWAALEKIYEAGEAREVLWRDLHPGGHAFAGNRAFEFFDRYL